MIIMLNVPLHSEKARARNRIIEIVGQKFKEYDKDRMDLVTKYGEKDPKTGELAMDEDGKNYKIKNHEKFNLDFIKLINADVVFDILPSNREYWRLVKGVIENTKVEMNVQDTANWEDILLVLETI